MTENTNDHDTTIITEKNERVSVTVDYSERYSIPMVWVVKEYHGGGRTDRSTMALSLKELEAMVKAARAEKRRRQEEVLRSIQTGSED